MATQWDSAFWPWLCSLECRRKVQVCGFAAQSCPAQMGGGGGFVGQLIHCLLVHPGYVTYIKAVLFLLPPDGFLVSTSLKGETTLLGARYTVSPG